MLPRCRCCCCCRCKYGSTIPKNRVKPHFRSGGSEHSTEGTVSLGDGPLTRSGSRNFATEIHNPAVQQGIRNKATFQKETPTLQMEQNGWTMAGAGELSSEVEDVGKMKGSQDPILQQLKQRFPHQSLTCC